jgi:hypothetical protein
MSAASKGILCGEILTINGLKKPSVRDFSVGGVKIRGQQVDDNKLRIDDLLEHGMDFVNLLDGGHFEDDSLIVRLWVEDLMALSEWRRKRHAQPLYKPGPVASDTALSRIIAFKPDVVAFKWTKRKRTEAVRFLDSGEMDHEMVASVLGCTAEDVRVFLERRFIPNHP